MPKPIEIREYATEKEMQRDANKWLIAGPFALIWKPKARWIVTYQRR